MKKKLLFLLPILLLGVGLAACNEQQQPTEPNTPNLGGNENPNGNVNQPQNPTPTKPTYSVKITLPNGTAATGAKAQWCSGTECKTPVAVNSLGVASNKMDDVEGGYFVHVAEGTLPTGYTYNPNIYTTDETHRDIEIKLLRIETPKSGEGTKEAPYQVGAGTYVVKVEKALEYPYYTFTTTEPGTYEIESLAVDKLATTIIEPLYINYGADVTTTPNYVYSGGIGKNFKTTFTITAEQSTHCFGISFNSSKNAMGKDVPAEYAFTITKKSN